MIPLIMTLSFSALLAFGVMMVTIIGRFRMILSKRVWLAVLLLMVSVAVGNTILSIWFNNDIISLLHSRFLVKQSVSFEDNIRVVRAISGIKAFFSAPFFGVGIGNLGDYFPYWLKRSEIITSHSLYLDILSTAGLIGFAFFGALFLTVLRRLKRIYKKDYMSRAFVGALLGLSSSQLFYSNLYHPSLAVILGIVASYAVLSSHPTKGQPRLLVSGATVR
jgi:O-antigen ligase